MNDDGIKVVVVVEEVEVVAEKGAQLEVVNPSLLLPYLTSLAKGGLCLSLQSRELIARYEAASTFLVSVGIF